MARLRLAWGLTLVQLESRPPLRQLLSNESDREVFENSCGMRALTKPVSRILPGRQSPLQYERIRPAANFYVSPTFANPVLRRHNPAGEARQRPSGVFRYQRIWRSG